MELLKLIDSGVISGKIAKSVFEEMYATGKGPGAIVEEKGLKQVKDEGAIESVVDEVLAENPGEVAQFRAGKAPVTFCSTCRHSLQLLQRPCRDRPLATSMQTLISGQWSRVESAIRLIHLTYS